MKNLKCQCIHCEWQKKKAAASFTEFYSDWVRDNIQYAGPVPYLTKISDNLDLSPTEVSRFESDEPHQLLNALPQKQKEAHLDNLEKAKRGEERAKPLSLSLPPKLTGHANGFEWFKIYEHKIQTGWRCATEGIPPVPSGQRFSLHLSQKSRRTLLDSCHAFGRHFSRPTFATLTYAKSTCQGVAKLHFDTWWKRIKRQTGWRSYVWVAELQKRGVIHYHILLPGFLPHEWGTRAWHEITGGVNHTHFVKVERPWAYMAKYFAKAQGIVRPEPITGRRWSCSADVVQWRKPLYEVHTPTDFVTWTEQRPKGPEWTAFDYMSTRDISPDDVLTGSSLDRLHMLKK